MAMEEHAMDENAIGEKPFESPSGQQRIVNVHQAKTHLSRLIDAAHGGETILLAKAGKPWAEVVWLSWTAPIVNL